MVQRRRGVQPRTAAPAPTSIPAAWRLRNVLETALSVALFAATPLVRGAFGLGNAAAWRWSALGFLVWNVAGVVMSALRARALQQAGTDTGSGAYLSLFPAMELTIDLPLLAVVLSLLPGVASALYLAALVMSLVQAGLFFLRLVGSLLVAVVE
jgi:hypothetical protein